MFTNPVYPSLLLCEHNNRYYIAFINNIPLFDPYYRPALVFLSDMIS